MGSNISVKAALALSAALAVMAMSAGPAQAQTTYVWTGHTDNTLNTADNWLVGGVVPASAPAGSNNGFDGTPADDDTLLFDNEDTNWVRNPISGLYVYSAHDGSLDFANGSYTFKADRNSYRNRADVTSGITMTVGDGDGTTAASVSSGLSMLNAGGTATKTYVVHSDGTLIIGNNRQNNAGYTIWSGGNSAGSDSLDTVIQIIGGTVISGKIYETPLTGDAGDYASFEALGSTLTFDMGTEGVSFGSLSDVTDQFGGSFRLGGALSSANAELQATYDDANSTFTVTAVDLSGTLGDANGDGVVDSADYIMVKTHFGGAPAAGTEGSGGDFNDNGTVDWDDLQTLMEGFNPAGGTEAIPEPATLLIMMAAGLPVMLKRRQRRS